MDKKLNPKFNKSAWDTYSLKNTYESNQEKDKLELVKEFIKFNKPNYLADMGCNDGMYSVESLNEGAKKYLVLILIIIQLIKLILELKKKILIFYLYILML